MSSIWKPKQDQYWGDSANWSDGVVPGSEGATASAIFPSPIPINKTTVTLNEKDVPLNISLRHITFQDDYIIKPYFGAGSLSGPSSGSFLFTVENDAKPQIQVPLTCTFPASLAFAINQGASCNLLGELNLLNSSLTQTGEGLLFINNSIQSATIKNTTGDATLIIAATNLKTIQAINVLCNSKGAGDSCLTIQNTTASFGNSITCSNACAGVGNSTITISNSTLSSLVSTQCVVAQSIFSTGNAKITIIDTTCSQAGSIGALVSSGGISTASIIFENASISTTPGSGISCINNGISTGCLSKINILKGSKICTSQNMPCTLVDGTGPTEILIDHSTLTLEKSAQALSQNRGNLGDALVTITNATLSGTGSIQCMNSTTLNGNSTFTIDTSTLNLESVQCITNGSMGNTLLTLTNANVSLTKSIECYGSTSMQGTVTLIVTNSNLFTEESINCTNSAPAFGSDAIIQITKNSKITTSQNILCALTNSHAGGVASIDIDSSTVTLSKTSTIECTNSANNGDVLLSINKSQILGTPNTITLTNSTAGAGNLTLAINNNSLVNTAGIACTNNAAGAGKLTLTIQSSKLTTSQNMVCALTNPLGAGTASISVQDSTLTLSNSSVIKCANLTDHGDLLLSINNSQILGTPDFITCTSSSAGFGNLTFTISNSSLPSSMSIQSNMAHGRLGKGYSQLILDTISWNSAGSIQSTSSSGGSILTSILLKNSSIIMIQKGVLSCINNAGNFSSGSAISLQSSKITTSQNIVCELTNPNGSGPVSIDIQDSTLTLLNSPVLECTNKSNFGNTSMTLTKAIISGASSINCSNSVQGTGSGSLIIANKCQIITAGILSAKTGGDTGKIFLKITDSTLSLLNNAPVKCLNTSTSGDSKMSITNAQISGSGSLKCLNAVAGIGESKMQLETSHITIAGSIDCAVSSTIGVSSLIIAGTTISLTGASGITSTACSGSMIYIQQNSNITTSNSIVSQLINISAGGDSSITIDCAIVTLQSLAALECTSEANAGDVLTTINESTITAEGSISCSSGVAGKGNVILKIIDATVTTKQSILCTYTPNTKLGQGSGNAIITISGSTISGESIECQNKAPGYASISFDTSTISVGSINCASVFESGSISLLSGKITVSHTITASGIFEQLAAATLQITPSTTTPIISANTVTLGGTLIVDLSHFNSTEPILLISSKAPLISKFSTCKFINTPSGATPSLNYTNDGVYLNI